MKDFEPFDQYSAYDHSKPTVPSVASANTNEVQGVARYFPPRLSLREHFAGMAMQGILSNSPDWTETNFHAKWVSETSVKYAEALIKELNK